MIGHYGELESKELVLPFQQCLNYCECLPLNCSVVLLGIDQFVWHEPCQSACFSLRPWGSPFSQHTDHTYQFWGRIQTSLVAQILLQDVPHALLWCCSKRTCMNWPNYTWRMPLEPQPPPSLVGKSLPPLKHACSMSSPCTICLSEVGKHFHLFSNLPRAPSKLDSPHQQSSVTCYSF